MARPERGRGKSSEKRQSIRDKARQAAEERERGGGGLDTLKDLPDGIEFFKPKMGKGTKGENFISIVPYQVSIDNHPYQTAGELWHECTYWVHKVGGGQDSKRFICLAKTAQSEEKRCPICEYREKLIRNGQDPELAEELKPKQRQLFNVLDHDDEDKGIQIFEMSPHMFGFMLDDEDAAQSERHFDGKFYGDPWDGLALIARFDQGSFQGHKFPEISRIDFENRDDLPDDILEQAVDWDAHLRILSYEELKNKFFEFGGDKEEDHSESPEQEHQRERSRTSRTREPEREEKQEGRTRRGRSEPEEPKDELPPKEERSRGSRESRRDRKQEPDPEQTNDDNPCPAGLNFGTDCDTDEACDTCKVWDDCKDKQDELKAEARNRTRKK